MSTRIKRAHTRRRGVLITFEGIEGSGKTTQLAKLATRLREQLFQVVETREPGGTPLAEQIRGLMLNIPRTEPGHTPKPDHEFIAPESEAALVFAARSQHVIQVIEPAIADGAIILCDRFSDSTLAYQGYARGLDMRTLILFNRLATRGVLPALTLLFDLPVDTGLARRRRQDTDQNRLDRETRSFHSKVRQGFLDLAKRHHRRIKIIRAAGHPDDIAVKVWEIIDKFLTHRKDLRSSC
jgi:dTMP kinase